VNYEFRTNLIVHFGDEEQDIIGMFDVLNQKNLTDSRQGFLFVITNRRYIDRMDVIRHETLSNRISNSVIRRLRKTAPKYNQILFPIFAADQEFMKKLRQEHVRILTN